MERQSFKHRCFEMNQRKRTTILETETCLCWICYKRGSGDRNALIILEGKIKGKKAKGRLKRMWFDEISQWTMLKDHGEVKRSADDRVVWRATMPKIHYIHFPVTSRTDWEVDNLLQTCYRGNWCNGFWP